MSRCRRARPFRRGATWNDALRRPRRRSARNRKHPMEYRPFGKTGREVSAIGFGCWEIGGTYGRIDESEFRRAVPQAIGKGINCFDTAEAYGMGVSEEAL